ncbi:hypothetical protein L1987_89676 [Smallanthus sonchifolius]|nr:hypothetical protein L1987_89676 [Smallanthus sonchifolius]
MIWPSRPDHDISLMIWPGRPNHDIEGWDLFSKKKGDSISSSKPFLEDAVRLSASANTTRACTAARREMPVRPSQVLSFEGGSENSKVRSHFLYVVSYGPYSTKLKLKQTSRAKKGPTSPFEANALEATGHRSRPTSGLNLFQSRDWRITFETKDLKIPSALDKISGQMS